MAAPLSDLTVQYLQRRSNNARFAAIEADLMPTLTALKLDLTRSTYVGRKGDLVCFITDIELGARKREPALMLANRTNPSERQVLIPMSQLWLLIDPEDVQAANTQAAAVSELAGRLYGFVTRPDLHRVLDAIYEFAQDLVHAKPPVWMTHAQWLQALAEDDMTVNITINGQQVG